MSTNLEGKVAVVTGGAQGLGRAISQRLAREGCKLVVADINEAGAQEAAAAVAAETGGTVLGLKTDVSKEAEVESLFAATVKQFGRVDIVVSNAAILIAEPICEADAAKWRAVMDAQARRMPRPPARRARPRG